ncbi:MAG: hypothetical protein Q6M04_07110 [Thermostichus sp. BF3_bins_97]
MRFRLSLIALLLMALSLSSTAQAQPRQRTRITTTQSGGSLTIRGERTSTGPGTFSNSGSYTRTGPNGGSGSGTYSGQGSRRLIPGLEGEYSGQITTERGQTWNLNHQHNTTRTDEGWQRQGNTTVQNAEGETVGSSSAIIKGQPGEGWQRTGQFDTARGQSFTTESSGTPTGPGQWRRKTRVFNDEGELLGGSDTDVQYQLVPGQGWVKTVDGNTLNEQPIRRTTTVSPNP